MSNYPLSYKLSWLPRFLKPSMGGDARGFACTSASFLQPLPDKVVRLAFIGDISGVANRVPPLVDPAISTLLGSADLVVGNCESPVVALPRRPLQTRLGTHHAMTAPFLGGVLDAAGLAPEKLVLSLANNHALDQKPDGFAETMASLARMGVRTIGMVADGPVARVDVGALTIGLAAFTLWRNGGQVEFASRVSMECQPETWKSEGVDKVDLMCAVPHWGWEFRHYPQAATRVLAEKLAKAGVGLIAGHHAHVVQPLEEIGRTPIAYGLGDFLGTAFSRQPWPGRIGAILMVDVSADAATRGAVAAYRMHFFYRSRDGRREHLVPVDTLAGRAGVRARQRVTAIFDR